MPFGCIRAMRSSSNTSENAVSLTRQVHLRRLGMAQSADIYENRQRTRRSELLGTRNSDINGRIETMENSSKSTLHGRGRSKSWREWARAANSRILHVVGSKRKRRRGCPRKIQKLPNPKRFATELALSRTWNE